MLQFPYAVNPNNSQAVDGTVSNKFTCIISGTICTAYQIEILNNNTNTKVYSGDKTSILAYNLQEIEMNVPANSFTNGNDLIWKMRLWTNRPDMIVVSGNILKDSTTTEIKVREYTQIKVGHVIEIGGQKREVKRYSAGVITVDALSKQPAEGDQFKIYSDFIDTPYYFFKSRSRPVVNITNYTQKITDRKYKFTGSYAQLENVPVQYFLFNLYSGNEIIDTTGQIFSANFEYEFDGFISGQEYGIEFVCMSQDFIEETTGVKNFTVSYQKPSIDFTPDVNVLHEKDAISISWQLANQSIPEVYGEYDIIKNFPFSGTNSVSIDKDSSITYKDIDNEPVFIDEDDFTVLASTNLDDDFSGKILSLNGDSDEYYVALEGNTFYYVNGVEQEITPVILQDKVYMTKHELLIENGILTIGDASQSSVETDLTIIEIDGSMRKKYNIILESGMLSLDYISVETNSFVLRDRTYNTKYELLIENGVLVISEVDPNLEEDELNIVDISTMAKYRIKLESGVLILEETSGSAEIDEIVITDGLTRKAYSIILESGILSLKEV